jgi:hypothetical protein
MFPYGFAVEVPGFSGLPGDEPLVGIQVMKPLVIRVLDPAGQPVSGATVMPWALRSSQGHGWWGGGEDRAGVEPKAVITGEEGQATVFYPYWRDLKESTRTIGVSLHVDHPDFAFPDAIHVDALPEGESAYEVKLDYGVPVELRPTILGESTDTDDLFAFWSDGRSWQAGDSMERTGESTLRLPPLKPGAHSVLVAKMEGERVTHISEILNFEVLSKEGPPVDLALKPAKPIEGVLSDNVPRPVTNGRIKLQTLVPSGESDSRVTWFSWVPIRADGTFAVESWPAGEKIQLIALCDGFIAQSGQAPAECENPRDPDKDPFNRPQVFDASGQQPITVEMERLVQCVVMAVDEQNKPVAEITVGSCPNVGWWNSGSQIYCGTLVRGERLLRVRDYQACLENDFPPPFQATTDARGNATLELPEGKESLYVDSDLYELTVLLGRRDVPVGMVAGEVSKVTLRLQPSGTEKLGEWDKLAGVVFGCSTKEGRRICALPQVRKKMDEFTKRFRAAQNQRDPKLLSEAYTIVSEAFADINDIEEAAKWQQKAAEQAVKAEANLP